MNNRLLEKIDALIDEARAEVAEKTIKFVNIKSYLDTPAPGAPFGVGVKKVLDTFLEMAEKEGFYGTDYNVGVVSAAFKEGQPDLGIWIHGDVVPTGDGWSFEPYNAVEYDGRIIGRGSADNKGQLAAMFVLFKIFKKLGIELKYNPAIYLGSNEESGKFDLLGIEGNDDAKGFNNVCTPPKMSLVPDGAFPVGYGGKGNMNLKFKLTRRLDGLRLSAGLAGTPGKAEAAFDGIVSTTISGDVTVTNNGNTVVEAFSPPIHSAHPNPEGNMLTKLSRALLASDALSERDSKVFTFLEIISRDVDGAFFGLNIPSKDTKPLTMSCTRVEDIDGCPEFTINARFPYELTSDQVRDTIAEKAQEYGFELSSEVVTLNPYLLDKEAPVVKLLNKIANDVMGTDKPPYTVGGGTYAHRLPNAYVFGSSSNFPPESWEKGRGGAHGVDEAVSLDRLQRAMRIYARALLALNETEW